jgi:hypothetical protein
LCVSLFVAKIIGMAILVFIPAGVFGFYIIATRAAVLGTRLLGKSVSSPRSPVSHGVGSLGTPDLEDLSTPTTGGGGGQIAMVSFKPKPTVAAAVVAATPSSDDSKLIGSNPPSDQLTSPSSAASPHAVSPSAAPLSSTNTTSGIPLLPAEATINVDVASPSD